MSTSVSSRSAAVHPTRQQLDELDALLQRMLDLPVNQVDEAEAPDDTEPPAAEVRPPVSYKVPIADPPPRLEPRVIPADEPPVSPPPRAVAPPPPPPAPPTPEPPAPARAAAREPGPDDWVRLASTWQPSAQTWQPLAQSWQQAARTGERQPTVPTSPLAPKLPPATPPAPPARALPAAPPMPGPEPVEAPEPESLEDLIVPRETTPPAPAVVPEPEGVSAAAGYDWWQWPFVAINVVYDVGTMALGPLGAGLRTRAGRNLLAAVGIGCLAAAGALVAADWIGWIW